MSELTLEQAEVASRFNGYVAEHAAQALLWVIKNRYASDLPFQRVEFETFDRFWGRRPPWNSEMYAMELYVTSGMVKKEHKSVLIEGDLSPEISYTPDARLGRLISGYNPEQQNNRFRVVSALMNRLDNLEERRVFVPAYRRSGRH